MVNLVKNLQALFKLLEKHRGLITLGSILVIFTLPIWLWFLAPEHPFIEKYWHSSGTKLNLDPKEANFLQEILLNLLVDNNSDLVAIAYYLVDKEGLLYISIGNQIQRGAIAPILNSKYYLITNQLWERYRVHRSRECFTTYFDLSATWSISCGVFYRTELVGYITVEFKSKPTETRQRIVENNIKRASEKLEFNMPIFFNKLHKEINK